MNRKVNIYLILISLLILTGACKDIKVGLGFEKDQPNEFLIEKRDAIVLPPDYKILPPDTNSESIKKTTKDSLKSIIDNKIITRENQITATNNKETSVEIEILKQIK